MILRWLLAFRAVGVQLTSNKSLILSREADRADNAISS